MNAYSPSFMNANITTDCEVKVTYELVHFGHKSEVRYIHLIPEERTSIATKLAKKIPHEE